MHMQALKISQHNSMDVSATNENLLHTALETMNIEGPFDKNIVRGTWQVVSG